MNVRSCANRWAGGGGAWRGGDGRVGRVDRTP